VSVSKGSVGELRGQLIYSLDIGLIPESRYEELDTIGISAARLLGGPNRYLSGSERRGRKFDRRRKANLQPATYNYSSRTFGNFDKTRNPVSVTTPSSS